MIEAKVRLVVLKMNLSFSDLYDSAVFVLI